MNNKKNLFIAFEGIDGSGKSTQVRLLAQFLRDQGHKVVTTCEPTDSPIGKMIRDIFNHKMEADQRVIATLFASDRLQHILDKSHGILKRLNEGYTVITDRYYFSSYAYHSVHEGIDLEWVIKINELSARLLKPDLNIYIDISPEYSMERLKKSRQNLEMYETSDNQLKVYNMYEKAFKRLNNDEYIVKINGEKSIEKVAQEIQARVLEFSSEIHFNPFGQ